MRQIFVVFVTGGALACSGGEESGGTTQPSNGAPAISLSSSVANFSAIAGSANPVAQTVSVMNTGTGTLSGLSVGTIAYGSGQSAGWLSANLSSATAPATMTLTPSTSQLAAGTYNATVPITSSASDATNSPQAMAVTLTMLPATASSVTLAAAGQSQVFLTSSNFAAALNVQAGSQYLVAVVNTDQSYDQLEGFSLVGSFAASPSAQRGPAAAAPHARITVAPQPSLPVEGGKLPPSMSSLRSGAQNHMAVLDANRQIFARFGNPSAAWAKVRSTSRRAAPLSAALVPVSQAVGTVNKVYVRNTLDATCTTVDSIGARTVAVGQHIVVLADTNTGPVENNGWPNALRPDSSWYQTFANEYDQITYPHILANIGNPMAYDSSLSSVGKITVTITPVLNNFGGLGGGAVVVAFVNSCDFYPYAATGSTADFSNQTEMFYSWIPGSANYTVADWEAGLRATAAHESKHIVSYTDRIISGAPFELIWLEEGLAQVSSEIWERNFNQATWKGNATFAQTAACEIDLGANAPCDLANNKPYALLGSHLPFFFDYLQTESSYNGEGLGYDTPSNYGAGWTLARWAIDQYATSGEAPFIKSLINEPVLTGLPNLASHTGQSIATVLVYWNLATAIFQTPGYTAADARTTIPSFNFADIFNVGQTKLTCNGTPCGLFSSSGQPIYPVAPIALTAAGTFSNAVSGVPGTSASYFLLTAPSTGIESLQLLTSTGAALSSASGLRVAILRVQ